MALRRLWRRGEERKKGGKVEKRTVELEEEEKEKEGLGSGADGDMLDYLTLILRCGNWGLRLFYSVLF